MTKEKIINPDMPADVLRDILEQYAAKIHTLAITVSTHGEKLTVHDMRNIRYALSASWLPDVVQELTASFMLGNRQQADHATSTIMDILEQFS